MRKILVYVDAENISVDQFNELQHLVREELNEDGIVIGKFYGSHSVLGGIVQACLQVGYEYVDTYPMCNSNKNVTDMKMTVDCIYDVVQTYSADTKVVYVASSDHDFVPLIHKLQGQKCEVRMPFLVKRSLRTCADLSKDLVAKNFDAVARQRILDNPFSMIKECVGDEFMDDVIEAFVMKKQRKIASVVTATIGIEDGNSVLSIPPTDFSYQRLQVALDTDKISNLELLDVYTKKMYGLCLPARDAEELLRGGENCA